MSESCYVVAMMNTKAMTITDAGFYSAPAHGLTMNLRGDDMYLDVWVFSGVDYHQACVNAVKYVLDADCPTFLRWLRPFAERERTKLLGYTRGLT